MASDAAPRPLPAVRWSRTTCSRAARAAAAWSSVSPMCARSLPLLEVGEQRVSVQVHREQVAVGAGAVRREVRLGACGGWLGALPVLGEERGGGDVVRRRGDLEMAGAERLLLDRERAIERGERLDVPAAL